MKKDLKKAFTAIDNTNLVDKVENKLIEIFINKELKAGDVIPKEIELAKLMGVSRTVIRESLNRLKTIDIIETKKHLGSVIKSPNLFNLLQKPMIHNILDNKTLKDIFEMRLVIEVGLADFIVHRVTDKDIEDLQKIVLLEPEKTIDIPFNSDHEAEFHAKLYEITGNQSILQLQKLLLSSFDYVYKSGLINKTADIRKHFSHKQIVEALKTRDAEKFRNAMRAHLENHFKRILD